MTYLPLSKFEHGCYTPNQACVKLFLNNFVVARGGGGGGKGGREALLV